MIAVFLHNEYDPRRKTEPLSHRAQIGAIDAMPLPTSYKRRVIYSNLVFSDRLFPSVFEDTALGEGLKRATELVQEGYGLVIFHNHFSMRDPFEVAKQLFRNVPPLQRRPILFPIAKHWYDNDPRSKMFADAFDVTLWPVVTSDTKKTIGFEEETLGRGNLGFLREALKTLRQSGAVIIAPQTGRRDYLGEPSTTTMEQIVRTVKKQKERNERLGREGKPEENRIPEKIAFIFMGLGIKDAQFYQKEFTGGWNQGREYVVKVARTYTTEEFEEEAMLQNQGIDQYGFSILKSLVPKPYMRIPRDLSIFELDGILNDTTETPFDTWSPFTRLSLPIAA